MLWIPLIGGVVGAVMSTGIALLAARKPRPSTLVSAAAIGFTAGTLVPLTGLPIGLLATGGGLAAGLVARDAGAATPAARTPDLTPPDLTPPSRRANSRLQVQPAPDEPPGVASFATPGGTQLRPDAAPVEGPGRAELPPRTALPAGGTHSPDATPREPRPEGRGFAGALAAPDAPGE